jgi:2-hydroxychromene-2-carboxylate isomerase
MKHITFYFDVISPYAYLAFEQLPEALQGISYEVTYKPVLFAGLLKHHGQLGPAEIASKRAWTYRQVQWLARDLGIEFQMPATHPFNPLALLRLAVACGMNAKNDGFPNRYVVETLFRHVWCSGEDAENVQRLAVLTEHLKPVQAPDAANVKALLKAFTESAIEEGVFGVPTFKVDGKLFFGLDSLSMLAAYLKNDTCFDNLAWDSVLKIPVGTARL